MDFNFKMNQGFKDVLIVAEEIYQFDICSGEPTMECLNPSIYTLRSGYSSKIEDADIIILDDYYLQLRNLYFQSQIDDEIKKDIGLPIKWKIDPIIQDAIKFYSEKSKTAVHHLYTASMTAAAVNDIFKRC